MPIRPSSGAEIKTLIAALGGTDEVHREAAIGRLAVIGRRAVDHLLQAYPSAALPVRIDILRALEALADPRALPLACQALRAASPLDAAGHAAAGPDDADPDAAAGFEAAVAAAGTLRALLATREASKDALDALVSAALDGSRPTVVRTAAFDAIRELPRDIVDPIRAALAADTDPAVRSRAGTPTAGSVRWEAVVSGELPSDVSAVRALVAARGASARLTELQRLVDHVRSRETGETDQELRAEWRAVRGAIHQALAARGSRLALYDLRDSLMDEGALPVTFLSALEEVGDASCVEPLAAAYDASSRSSDLWWREHLASAFRAVVRREALTRRHLVVKRALARWPDATADLMARL